MMVRPLKKDSIWLLYRNYYFLASSYSRRRDRNIIIWPQPLALKKRAPGRREKRLNQESATHIVQFVEHLLSILFVCLLCLAFRYCSSCRHLVYTHETDSPFLTIWSTTTSRLSYISCTPTDRRGPAKQANHRRRCRWRLAGESI